MIILIFNLLLTSFLKISVCISQITQSIDIDIIKEEVMIIQKVSWKAKDSNLRPYISEDSLELENLPFDFIIKITKGNLSNYWPIFEDKSSINGIETIIKSHYSPEISRLLLEKILKLGIYGLSPNQKITKNNAENEFFDYYFGNNLSLYIFERLISLIPNISRSSFLIMSKDLYLSKFTSVYLKKEKKDLSITITMVSTKINIHEFFSNIKELIDSMKLSSNLKINIWKPHLEKYGVGNLIKKTGFCERLHSRTAFIGSIRQASGLCGKLIYYIFNSGPYPIKYNAIIQLYWAKVASKKITSGSIKDSKINNIKIFDDFNYGLLPNRTSINIQGSLQPNDVATLELSILIPLKPVHFYPLDINRGIIQSPEILSFRCDNCSKKFTVHGKGFILPVKCPDPSMTYNGTILTYATIVLCYLRLVKQIFINT